jgi:hypothetical protein
MIIEWIRLSKIGFPNRTGKGFLRVWGKTLLLAVLNYPRKRKIEFLTQPLKSNVWSSVNEWLQFQIRFINPKDWARSPVILAVAGGYSEKNNLDSLSFSKSHEETATELAQKYQSNFRGFRENDYKNWILKVCACLRTAEKMTGMSLINSNYSIAEIGPGMGSMAGIAMAYSSPNFYSYDTLEMQTIQRYVTMSLGISESRCTYFPINSEIVKSHADLPDRPYVLFAFWSFTEVNIFERGYYYDLIQNSVATVIACNNFFEGVNNFEFLESLAIELGKEIQSTDFLTIFGNSIPKFQKKHRLYTFK